MINEFKQTDESQTEVWDLYDENRKKTGLFQKRNQIIPEGYYHLVVSIWIVNDDGKYLISQRQINKIYPLYWECTGGAAIAGEDSMQTALREVKEELGIELDREKGKMIYQTMRKEHQDFYDAWIFHDNTDIKDLKLQKSEVIDAKWVSREEIDNLFKCRQLHPLLDYYQGII